MLGLYPSLRQFFIAESYVEQEPYTPFELVEAFLTDVVNENMQPNFGNARWIEQFVNNGIIPAMADRIYATGSDDLQHIEAIDITKAYETFKPKPIEPKPTRHRVKGFGA